MMLANDKRRGSRHPEQICKRHGLDRNKPLTLELLAEKCKFDIADLITIHDKYAKHPYKTEQKTEQKREADPFHDNGKVNLEEVITALDMLAKTDKKIKAIGTVKKLKAMNNIINAVQKKSPVLKKEKGYIKPIDEKAYLKVYEFVNRLERYKLGQLKNPPTPKKIANKYLKDD
jgi:hypothetical protein